MPDGCCAQCRGSGGRARSAEALLITEPGRPLLEGASPWFAMARAPERATVDALARRFAEDLARPWCEQPAEFRRVVLHGTGEEAVEIAYEATMKKSGTAVSVRDSRPWPGAIAEAERLYSGAASPAVRETYEPFVRNEPCAACEGTGLGAVARTVRLGGRRLHELLDRPVEDVLDWGRRPGRDARAAPVHPAPRCSRRVRAQPSSPAEICCASPRRSARPRSLKAAISHDTIEIEVDGDTARATDLLTAHRDVHEVSVNGMVLSISCRAERLLADLLRTLESARIRAESLRVLKPTLDDVFMTMTDRRSQRGADAVHA